MTCSSTVGAGVPWLAVDFDLLMRVSEHTLRQRRLRAAVVEQRCTVVLSWPQ
ncbi:hypothetical protein KCP74_14335 [Salmonella enterica subsp. enterica]|nr:hypothetical protein KCP74_14335 [Salmonella enterica subsp. enterica]